MPFPDDAVAELEALVRALRKDPLPLLLLSPSHFALTACGDMMAAVATSMKQRTGRALEEWVAAVQRSAVASGPAVYEDAHQGFARHV